MVEIICVLYFLCVSYALKNLTNIIFIFVCIGIVMDNK